MLGTFPARGMVAQWLKAGVVEQGRLHRTEDGVPQGGVVSPLLLNVALHGMEQAAGVRYDPKGWVRADSPVLVRYADIGVRHEALRGSSGGERPSPLGCRSRPGEAGGAALPRETPGEGAGGAPTTPGRIGTARRFGLGQRDRTVGGEGTSVVKPLKEDTPACNLADMGRPCGAHPRLTLSALGNSRDGC